MDNFDDIEAGDRVIVAWGETLTIATVNKATKTQVVVGYNRYRRSNGYLVGGGTWSRSHILRAEGAALDRARRQRLANEIWGLAQPMLSRSNLAKLDTKTLADMKRCMAGAARAMKASTEEKPSPA